MLHFYIPICNKKSTFKLLVVFVTSDNVRFFHGYTFLQFKKKKRGLNLCCFDQTFVDSYKLKGFQ